MAGMKIIPLIAEAQKEIKPLRAKLDQLTADVEELKERHFEVALELERLQAKVSKAAEETAKA